MTILLSFLGTGAYEACRYRTGAHLSSAQRFFSVALAEHLRPDQVLSLQTAAAAKKHGDDLAAALAPLGVHHQAVPIPEGKSEAELWQIFAALTEHVPHGCTLHLDITHGFRSLPLLGSLAISYLRVTRDITLGGIHYGAWEARDEAGVVPVFDLTPFLSLLDWTSAAQDFLTTGSAARLGGLLCGVQQSLWQNQTASDPSPGDLPKKLKSLGQSLHQASANLLLLRTGVMARDSAHLTTTLAAARAETSAHATPFLEVLSPVQEQLTRFQDTGLATLRDLVNWLAERGQTAAALTLANEWITSYLMVLCGHTNHHCNYQARVPFSVAASLLENPEMQLIEDANGTAARRHLEIITARLDPQHIACLKAAISRIRSARNDLNHAGFNETPAPAERLAAHAREIARELAALPIPGHD